MDKLLQKKLGLPYQSPRTCIDMKIDWDRLRAQTAELKALPSAKVDFFGMPIKQTEGS